MELSQATQTSIQSPKNSQTKTFRSLNLKKLSIPSKLPETPRSQRPSIFSYRLSIGSANLNLDPDEGTPCLSDRSHTIKIFKHKLQTEKHVNQNLIYKTKRGFDRPIQAGDTLYTVKAVVEKRKKEYEQRRRMDLRGSMYMNDLWGKDYEKDVIKGAKMKKDLERKMKFLQKPQEKHLPILNDTYNTKPPLLRIELDPSVTRLGTNTSPDELTPLSPYTPSHYLALPRKAFDTPVTEDSDYGITKPCFTEENSPGIVSPDKKYYQYRLIKDRTEKIHHGHRSLGGSYTPRLEGVIRGTSKNSSRGYEKSGGSWTMRNSYYAGSENSTRASTEAFGQIIAKEQSKVSLRRIHKEKGKKSWASREGISSTEISRKGTRAGLSRDFLGEKSHQVNLLMEQCEEQLYEKREWNGLINDMEGLFVNRKYDIRKKLEEKEKAKVIENCKYLLMKRPAGRKLTKT